ncbi:hypothetical protein GE107_07970 [Cohnella sp. CFH 77786]|uniref:hypothetical protein n=1 Tax=Cohnella sp. CFH 77786 TaxID=2662265 RepID=UPI001C60A514|nr:hypothetical protein [Cohnella sp. CFH 77786]MBW5445995.1 hypothetical protein [Cohnella sp. CFH 77786]
MSKDKASKADVQTTPANKLPVPDMETESAAEIVYGSEDNVESRSAFNQENQNQAQNSNGESTI